MASSFISNPETEPKMITLHQFRPGDVIRHPVQTPDGETIIVTVTLLHKKRDIRDGELWMVRRSDSRDHEFGHNFYHEATGEDGVSIVPRLYERIAQVPDVVPALPKGWQTKLGYTGRKDDGAWHRCVDIARRLYQEGLWNGFDAIEIKEPYKVHDLLFGVNPIPPQELTDEHYINHSLKPDVTPSHGGHPHVPALPPNYPFDDRIGGADITIDSDIPLGNLPPFDPETERTWDPDDLEKVFDGLEHQVRSNIATGWGQNAEERRLHKYSIGDTFEHLVNGLQITLMGYEDTYDPESLVSHPDDPRYTYHWHGMGKTYIREVVLDRYYKRILIFAEDHQEPDGTSPFAVENLYQDWQARVHSPVKAGMWVSGISPNDYPDDKWQITDVTRHESNGRIECWYSNSGDFECLLAYADELQDCVTTPPTPAELLRFEIRSDRFEMEELYELMLAAENAYITKKKAVMTKLEALADLEESTQGTVDGWATWVTPGNDRMFYIHENRLAEES